MAPKKILNPFEPILKKLPAPFRNRSFLVLAAFFFIMVFVDRHNVITQYRLQKAVDHLKSDKVFYEKKIKETKQERLDFEKNQEKYAREKYFVKKPKEEVFVIEEY